MCFVEIPHPIGMLPKPEVDAKAEKAFEDIVTAATKWQASKDSDVKQTPPYPANRIKFKGTVAELNKMFADRKWSLSLPIIPPTVANVTAMLKGTKHKPDEVLWVVPPRQGMLTVELVATLGVMAGAKPEHMPLLIAAVKAMAVPEAAWRGTSTTTANTYPLFVISGPIIEKFGLNADTGTAGGENPVTNALGYFVNLVGDVVGGSVPPGLDKTTQGSSADLVASVFVENAKKSPWPSFAVQQGFTEKDSIITISTSYPPNGNIDHNSVTGEGLLNSFAAGIAGTASGIGSCYAEYGSPDVTFYNNCTYVMLLVGPEHAATIAQDLSLEDAQKFLVANTVLPYKAYPEGICRLPESFDKSKLTPDTLLPRFVKPESIKMVVTGGAGKQSQIWVPFPQVTKPVSVKIED